MRLLDMVRGWFRSMGWPRVTLREGALTGHWRESEAEALARYLREHPDLTVQEMVTWLKR